ncbi:hypothetical protein CVT30_00030 [Streptomyces sp. AMCC400023]|nr:hypothetical protein CVT30_00030 [Streptomyces sp. AMCC400023]
MLFAVCGSLIATAFVVLRGSTGGAVPLLLMFVLLAGLNSPLAFERTRTRAPAPVPPHPCPRTRAPAPPPAPAPAPPLLPAPGADDQVPRRPRKDSDLSPCRGVARR